jgi:hypothetical protein
VSAHESAELLADGLQGTETVVLGESEEEVLQDVTLIGTGDLLELSDNLELVVVGESGGTEDGTKLGVGLQGLAEGGDGLGGLVEGGGLGGSSVLEKKIQVRKGHYVLRQAYPCLCVGVDVVLRNSDPALNLNLEREGMQMQTGRGVGITRSREEKCHHENRIT